MYYLLLLRYDNYVLYDTNLLIVYIINVVFILLLLCVLL